MDKAEGGEAVFTLFHHRNVGIYPFLTVFVTGLLKPVVPPEMSRLIYWLIKAF